jgi:hypothetical protein
MAAPFAAPAVRPDFPFAAADMLGALFLSKK